MLGVDGWTIEFELHGAENEQQQAETTKLQIEGTAGVLTVDEAREKAGMEPLGGAQGNMLVSELSNAAGGPGSATQPGGEAQENAAKYGYSITARKAEFGEADPIEFEGGTRGVVLEVYTEAFEWDGTEYEASSDSPKYVVATESAGARVVTPGDITASDWDEDVDADPEDVQEADAKSYDGDRPTTKDVGFDSWPDSWRDSPKPARLIALRAWVAMGASFSGCRREIGSARICAAFKDEVYQTTAWRS
jgi:hypothetical protein